MFLRSLTIKGFKSFARKTVLEFEPGVTVIVGPNGSGKSNIADAVMWVLGEQSPTSLRGNRMEDFIFAGSSSLKPVNLAEVSLTLDNSNNDFPLDYSEVMVTRNVVRGGDSEYRLNNNACRLLDIQELLSDAGVGRTLNSVISQGELDDVLSCRPEERRDYIEEAGGLLKYRKRREKAIRRLARMDEELLRTNDVAREVRRQLRPLQRQAGRLEQYTTLIREMNEARMRLDVARLRAMRREWQEHEENQAERSKRLDELDAEIKSRAAEASALEKVQADWRVREDGLRAGLYKLVSEHERLKAMLTLWEEKPNRAAPSLHFPLADPAELESLAAENVELARKRDELLAGQEGLRSRESAMASKMAELNATLNDLTRQRAGVEARLEVLQASRHDDPALSEERLLAKKEEIERLARERASLAGELDSLIERSTTSDERVKELEDSIEALHASRAQALESLRDAERRLAAMSATLEILTRLETESWGPANTSAALLEADPTGGGLGGMLVSSIKIDPAHETAVASYLGPWLYGLVAKDTNAIIVAIEHLKEKQLGQGLFFKHSGSAPVSREPEPEVAGAMRARDAVEAPTWFSDALDALLEGVYLARDLDLAVELAERHPHLIFLSPDGDVITGGTLIKGGSPGVGAATLELTAGRRQALEESLAEAREIVDVEELRQRAAGAQLEETRAELAAARAGQEEARAALEAARTRGASIEARIEAMSADAAGWRTDAEPEAQAPSVSPDELAARAVEIGALESNARAELEECDTARRKAAGDVREAASELASIERRLEIGRIKERDMRARGAQPQLPAGEPAMDESEIAMLVALHEKLVRLSERARESARRELEEGVLKEKSAAEGLRVLREQVAALQLTNESLRDQIHEEDLSRAELKVRVEQLVERIVDEHKVPLEFALKQYTDQEPTPEMEEKLEELSRLLEQIGPVNPEAIIERESLEQRHDFLKTQMDDIDQARTQLKRVIKQVDREIEQKFVETLTAVNGHFKTIFATLFPNGSAELRLTEPDDALNSGVEILAQPEGKRLRRISLLSGGETSLTALAFFFALFKVRPSPFYFLDEVEAALDDVNLHRFLDLVKEFRGESQLVLITHQKRSMEIADILYGVTMQDDGMSRVVSQRVEEKAAS